MEFEDFNYESFNEYILVRDKKKEERIKEKRLNEADNFPFGVR